MQKIGTNGDGKSAVANPVGRSRKKKKKKKKINDLDNNVPTKALQFDDPVTQKLFRNYRDEKKTYKMTRTN